MTTDPTSRGERYKLVFFSPTAALTPIRTAIFATGAGTIGAYTECSFVSTPGIGSFRPGDDANPAIGKRGKVEEVEEVRCEILCRGREETRRAVEALKSAHPYEEPAYDVYKLEDF